MNLARLPRHVYAFSVSIVAVLAATSPASLRTAAAQSALAAGADLGTALATAERQMAGVCTDNPSVAIFNGGIVGGMLTTDLTGLLGSGDDEIHLLERDRLKELLAEQCLADFLGPHGPSTGRLERAKFIVQLSPAYPDGVPFDVSLNVIRTDTGEVIQSSSYTVTQQDWAPELGAFLGEQASEIADLVRQNDYSCANLASNEVRVGDGGCARFRLSVGFDQRNTSGCNFDRHTADIRLAVPVGGSADEPLAGVGAGWMTHEPINRCPDTWYGGVRTMNEPFPIFVEGYRDDDGRQRVQLKPWDVDEYSYTSGMTYISGSILQVVFPDAPERGGAGTLEDFVLPADLTEVSDYQFDIKTTPQGGGWHEGTAHLELLWPLPQQ